MIGRMDDSSPVQPEVRITPRLVDSLYTEAMLLADEARSYFDDAGREDRVALEPFVRVTFACESLKVTTRIMHIVAWLLTQRAVETGEIQGHVDLPASTLSHHLKRLTDAGLLKTRGEGTSHYYSADYTSLRTLTDYLWEDCCRKGKSSCC